MIKDSLQGKTRIEKAQIKAKEIAKLKPFTDERKYKIVIQQINEIDGGVELFAQAWKNGKQIGFGDDGSVDIERFRIFNPPILARTGEKQTVIEDGKEVELDVFEENTQEALLQALEHIIDIAGKENSSIIVGKKGNTTDTFYPSLDGQVARDTVNESWSSIQSGSGTSHNDSNTTINVAYWQASGTTNQFVNSFKGIYLFDTSAIPDGDTISSATFSLYGSSASQTGTSTQDAALVGTTTSSTSSLANADYQTIQTTRYCDTDVTYASWSTSGYNNWAMNATGLAAVSTTGLTKLATNFNGAISGTAPAWGNGYLTQVKSYSSEQTGTSNDPTLVVTHSASANGNLLMFF